MTRLFVCFLAFWIGAQVNSQAETSPRLYAVEVSAQVAASPARITLNWPADVNATSYTIDRKLPGGAGWTRLTTLAGSAASYSDTAVLKGSVYEYQIIKAVPYRTTGVGYISAGIEVAPVENRGKLILLVDSTHAAALTNELRRLETDLIGDGWTVLRRDVARTLTPPQVKAIVKSDYSADLANVRSLFIFGHVAVPYSGDIYPDMHPDHKGAWPTDAYYADMDGAWTDTTVNTTSAEKLWNRNTPGDGKFDQDNVPTASELEVGRVDLFNMTCFANKTPSRSELDLLRQYLNKDHQYRQANFKLQRRGLICDNFGESNGEAFAANGWRNFAPFFGAANNVQVGYGAYFPTLAAQDYLFSYGTGGGGWYTCNGVGGSDDFALNDPKSVFSFVFGSYFGDWDNESSFLRAPLGSTTYTLVSAWAGRPHWFLHPMGLGETIGYTARLSQNNRPGGTYRPNLFAGGAHVSLMGDPTLRLHTVTPPRNLTVTGGTGNALSWQPSTDTNLVGYFVYRANSANGPFARISGATPVLTASFSDPAGTASHTYMLRAIKLESEASGTYYNLSQGIFAGATVSPAPTPTPAPAPATGPPSAPSNLGAASSTPTTATLSWQDNSANETSFALFRRAANESTFTQRASVGAGVTSFQDSVVAGVVFTYKVRAANAVGISAFSAEASAQTAVASPPAGVIASAALVSRDTSTMGSWKGVYGDHGHNVFGHAFRYPNYVTVSAAGYVPMVWDWYPTDSSALQRINDETRVAYRWQSTGPFEFQTFFNDAQLHRVSLYFLDWEPANRTQKIEVLNADTSALLATETISNFADGIYLTWDLRGRIKFRITPISGSAVLSAFFFSAPAAPPVQTPVFTPVSGNYFDAVQVSLASDAGAEIRYTLDGTEPTVASALYAQPFIRTVGTTVKARAFKSGFVASSTATANYQITPSAPAGTSAQFLGLDGATGGTWKGAYGADGHHTVADSSVIPDYATLSANGHQQWIWQYSTQDSRAVQRAAVDTRIAPCWYASSSFELDLNITSAAARLVSLYMLDWDYGSRSQKIEIIDAANGSLLHTTNLASFSSGAYAQYRIKGRVIIRVTRLAGPNAVLTSIFFDQ